MRWYIDTEFHEDGRTIDLISIGLVSERGDEYEAVSLDFDVGRAASVEWLRHNVLDKLPPPSTWKKRNTIMHELVATIVEAEKRRSDGVIEFWGYYSDYDWVALCQLFGRMIDLPAGFPMYCLDIKQEMHRLGVDKEVLPPPQAEHSALADARWNKLAHEWILDYEKNLAVRED